jgi:hypothetical protein
MERKCRECGEKLHGRADQKYCNDQCRNTYHNRLNGTDNTQMMQIMRILRKNRKILKKLATEEVSYTNKTELLNRGFDFGYLTHMSYGPDEVMCYFCFDFAYKPLENDYFAVFKAIHNDHVTINDRHSPGINHACDGNSAGAAE